jgi:hypothetical protein
MRLARLGGGAAAGAAHGTSVPGSGASPRGWPQVPQAVAVPSFDAKQRRHTQRSISEPVTAGSGSGVGSTDVGCTAEGGSAAGSTAESRLEALAGSAIEDSTGGVAADPGASAASGASGASGIAGSPRPSPQFGQTVAESSADV